MYVGFALTEHCNLRCPHCIRDDVTTVRSLAPELVLRTLDDAAALFGAVTASFTGGEPTLHPEWDGIVAGLGARGIPWRFVTNGWHMRRVMPSLDRHPPRAVRVSLSGATEEVHDAERGRGSFRRVLMAVALLTSRRVPAALSIVVDRRDRHQLRAAAQLAEGLGCVRLHFILPQPVPGSAARDSDLPPSEWFAVRDEVRALAAEPGRRTALQLDYGYPFDGPETPCETFAGERIYVDAHGRLSLCCQLSGYGGNARDAVADLRRTSLAEAWPRYREGLRALRQASESPDAADPLRPFPCLRCARALGKTAWLREHPGTPWHPLAVASRAMDTTPLVSLRYTPRGLAPR